MFTDADVVKIARGLLACVVGLGAFVHLMAVYAISITPALALAICSAWLAHELAPTWLLTVFEWSLVTALVAGAIALIVMFPLQTLALVGVIALLVKLPKLL